MNGQPHQSRAARVLKAIWSLMWDAANGWLDHRASRTGAALAFYTVFSLAPVLILSIAIAGFFFGEAAARGEIVGQIGDLVGPQGAQLVQSVLQNASRPGAGFIPTVVSIVTLILGANTALAELKTGLDQTWNVPPEKRTGFWYSVRTRLLSVGLILSLGFLLLVSLVISAALTALEKLLQRRNAHQHGVDLDQLSVCICTGHHVVRDHLQGIAEREDRLAGRHHRIVGDGDFVHRR